MKKIVYLIILGILINACDVEGGRHSTSSSNVVMSSSSVIENNSTTNSSSSSSLIFVSTGLPMISQEFIDLVNSIDISKDDAGEIITNAFDLFDVLEEWDYPEVLDAYNKLCEYEEAYNKLVNIRQKIDLFIEKVNALPEEITLNDEYLLTRAEDSYAKLDEELKENLEVIEAYEKLLEARNKFEILLDEEMLKKDEADVVEFLSLAGKVPNAVLTYVHYFRIKTALDYYEGLSERARTYEGVEAEYNRLYTAQQSIDVKDGTDLFDINIIHKGTNYECMLDIQGVDEEHKVTGQNKVFQLMVYENGAPLADTAILKWGDAPVATSYTRANGIHSFSFTIKKSYKVDYNYELEFIIKTDTNEAYAISIIYMVDKTFTSYGYTLEQFHFNQFEKRIDSLIREDYNDEGWARIEELKAEGQEALLSAVNESHAKMIISQYYQEITKVERVFTILEGAQVVEVSSKPEQINNMLDGKTGTSWQATSTTDGYIIIDIGDIYSLVGMSIMWQNSNAKDYTIKFSDTNENWDNIDPIYSFDQGKSGDRTDEVRFTPTSGRYIRIDMGVSTTSYGFRIYEIYLFQERTVI